MHYKLAVQLAEIQDGGKKHIEFGEWQIERGILFRGDVSDEDIYRHIRLHKYYFIDIEIVRNNWKIRDVELPELD